jgi:signal transduction histidine kinase
MGQTRSLSLQNNRLLDLAICAAAVVVTLLGMQGIPGTPQRVAALALGVAFVLNYGLWQRFTRLPQTLYFGVQSGLVAAQLALGSSAPDMFNFLLFVLSIQAAVALPTRRAAAWIGLFFAISAVWVLAYHGIAGLPAMIFFVVAHSFSGIFGRNLAATELAHRDNQELLDALLATQAKLQALAVMEERNRLSREMHDSLGHRLTTAVVQLEGAERLIPLDPARAAGIVRAMREELKEALAELRHMVAALRREGLPLDAELRRLAERFEASTGLAVGLQLPPDLPLLPEAHELALYRAAQEGLTNVQRHAAAGHVRLGLALADDGIWLTVSDDGQGTAAGAPREGGFGLRGMRERAAPLGGQLDFRSTPGEGTRLSLWLPLPRARTRP